MTEALFSRFHHKVKSKSLRQVHTIPKWYSFHWGILGYHKNWPKLHSTGIVIASRAASATVYSEFPNNL